MKDDRKQRPQASAIPRFATDRLWEIYFPFYHNELRALHFLEPLPAIPEPRGQACSKCRGSLEMPALRAEGEIRDERFWPERGKNQGIGHTAVAGSYRRADSKLRGRAVPKVNGADHGDRADGMKSW